MTPKLSHELSQALHDRPGTPLEVEDPQTHIVYVLVARDDFRRLQLRPRFDDRDLTAEEMLAAAASSLDDPEGWGAPGMEEYDVHGGNDANCPTP